MSVYILLINSFVFTLLNYYIGRNDIFNPSLIFCGMNLIYSSVCIVMKAVYGIDFRYNTVLVLAGGMFIFTAFNLFRFERFRVKSVKISKPAVIKYYNVRKYWLILFVLFELIVAFFMLKYARDVTKAYYGSSFGIEKALSGLNDIQKNNGDELIDLNVHASIFYSAGWPLVIAFNMLLSAIAINNYNITKRIQFNLFIPYLLMIVMSFFLGSRSSAFRFVTMFLVQWIIIRRWFTRRYRKGQIKMFARILAFLVIILSLLMVSINIIGRQTSIPFFEYFTAYVGAPFYNLDIAINNGLKTSVLFGQETFHHLYSFLGSRFGIKEWRYTLNIPYQRYNGKYLGNVYTMYYMFLEDFGSLGMIVLSSIIAIYYNYTYKKILDYKRENSFMNMKFLFYSYFFNDLIMLTFSNRFYESAFGKTGILLFFWMFVIWHLFKHGFFTNVIEYPNFALIVQPKTTNERGWVRTKS